MKKTTALRLHLQLLFLCLIVGLVMFWPALAFADDGSGDAGTVKSIDDLVRLVVTTAVGATVAFVGKHLVGWLKKSTAGKKAAKAIDDFKLEQMIADAAIHYAEEQAHKAIKLGGQALDANAKLRFALDYAKRHGLVDDAIGRVVQIIEARLGVHRIAKKASSGS